MASIVPISQLPSTQERLLQLENLARELVCGCKSSNTLRSYKSDWKLFEIWCQGNGFETLPAEPKTVGLYLTYLATIERRKTSTIKRCLYAIGYHHGMQGYESPREDTSVRAVMSGIRRRNGARQIGKEPLLKDNLHRMILGIPETVIGIRDKAILLFGFFSACRRSELCKITVKDLEFTDEGLILTLKKSKTDQNSDGRRIGVPYASDSYLCPVTAVQNWLSITGIKEGALFRGIDRHGNLRASSLSDGSIALIVKRAATAAGIDSANLSAHSLRAGFCTEAAINGVEERLIMKQTGHKTERVVRGYIREAVFQNNGAQALSF